MKKSAVLYHYPCPDGAFAALAAHLYFSAASLPALFFPNPVYNPIRSENLPLDEIKDVYLLDFVGPSGFVEEISQRVERVIVLDHHKTALEALDGSPLVHKNVTKVIDMQRSGATIAFDFFKEKILGSATSELDHNKHASSEFGVFLPHCKFERIHRLFKYIEDADLWRWVLADTEAFSSGLKDMAMEFDVNLNPVLFDQLLELDPDQVIHQGQATLAHKNKLIEEALEHSYQIALGGGSFGHCLAVDGDSVAKLRSQLGHRLAEKSLSLKLRGIGAVVYRVPEIQNDKLLKVSLRSVDSEDTTQISTKYGGGGHCNASSFMLNTSEFELWKV